MADVKKPIYTKPIPKDAKIITRRGKQYARFTQRGGGIVDAEILPGGKRCRVTASTYSGWLRTEAGTRLVPLGVSDRAAAREKLAKLQVAADRDAAGMPVIEKKSLIGSHKPLPVHKQSVVDRAERRQRDILEAIRDSYLEGYRNHLVAKAVSDAHLRDKIRRLRRLCIACGFRQPRDITASRFEKHLAAILDGRSYCTRNLVLCDLKSFINWMRREKVLSENPLEWVTPLNVAADPGRRYRRNVTPDLPALVAAAKSNRTKIGGLSGPDRAALYEMAFWTGYRRKELSQLTLDRLCLDTDPATAYVPISQMKVKIARYDRPIPLHPAFVKRLRVWLAARKPANDEFLWPIAGNLTSKMIRHDLAAAGLPFETEEGRADFHALRVSFVSFHHECGVDLATLADMARHSDPKLTRNIYNRISQKSRADVLKKLPDPFANGNG